jgi:hypothetical protein
MKPVSTLFLKGVLIVMALAVAGFCLIVLPIGIRAEDSGMYRPILIGLYVPAIPFFVALWQSFKLLNLIDGNKAFSEASVKAFKAIKYCGVSISALFLAGMPFIFSAADKDDAPGVVLIGLIIIGASFVIAVFAAVLQKLIQSAIEIKSENDLTV